MIGNIKDRRVFKENFMITKCCAGLMCLLVATFFLPLLISSAEAQDNFQWTFSEGNDPDNKGRMTATLQFGVPETDNIQFTGICDAAPSTSVRFSVLTLATDIADMKRGKTVRLRFSGGGSEIGLDGEVSRNDAEEGIAGVIVRPDHSHPIWKFLTSRDAVEYLVPGYRTSSLKLTGGHENIGKFVTACKSYQAAIEPKTIKQNIGGKGDGITEKEAFEQAKDLGAVEGWNAFLAKFPTGFRAELARAYVKKLSLGAGGAGAAISATSPASGTTGQPSTPPPFWKIPAGNGRWSTNYQQVSGDGGNAKFAATISNGGAQLVGYCQNSGGDSRLVLLVRPDAFKKSTPVDRVLRYAASSAPLSGSSGDGRRVREIAVRFDDGTSMRSATTYDNVGAGGEFAILKNGMDLGYRSGTVGDLMSKNSVTISAASFTFTFGLSGSRGALCSVLNRCGAKRADCGNTERVRPVSIKKRTRCRGGQYYSKSRGRCRCRSGFELVNGRCLRNDELSNSNPCGPGYTQVRGKCIHNNDLQRNKRVQPRVNQAQQAQQRNCQQQAKICSKVCNILSGSAKQNCKTNCWQQCAAH